MFDLANLHAPIETANGLLNAYYIDLTMYQHEQNTLIRNIWLASGFSSKSGSQYQFVSKSLPPSLYDIG